VAAAIEAYVTKLMETNAASRALWTEMRELYPAAGPLEATITRLGAWEVGSSPWTEHGTSNMAERMRMAAEEPTAQVRPSSFATPFPPLCTLRCARKNWRGIAQ
jgi:hypothetical protein